MINLLISWQIASLPSPYSPSLAVKLAVDGAIRQVVTNFRAPMSKLWWFLRLLSALKYAKHDADVADAFSLPGIEPSPAVQIPERRRQDIDFHSARLRSGHPSTKRDHTR